MTATIRREQLVRKLARAAPANEDPSEGFALVNVLAPEAFARERIPGSNNIRADRIDLFEARFDKEKEIIVYCASPSCEAAVKVAEELARRGFRRVAAYRGGLADWKAGGQPVSGRAA